MYNRTVHFVEVFFSMRKRGHVHKEWREGGAEGGAEGGRGVSPEEGGGSVMYSTMCVWTHQLRFFRFSLPTRLEQQRR